MSSVYLSSENYTSHFEISQYWEMNTQLIGHSWHTTTKVHSLQDETWPLNIMTAYKVTFGTWPLTSGSLVQAAHT